MRLSLLVPILSLLSLAACGGSVDGSSGPNGGPPGANPPGTNPPGTNPPATTGGIEGSFDLTFTDANATFDVNGPPGDGQPPSLSTAARLDIRKDPSGGYAASLTARWGVSASYAVAVDDKTVTLTGKGSISAQTSVASGASDVWETLTLPRTADGGLTGEIRGTGEEMVGEGDEMWSGKLTGNGRIVKDATAPEIKASITSLNGPADALLPWDPITIRAAEPVEKTGVEEQTQISGDHGDSLAIRWEPQKDVADWPGLTMFAGHVDDWTRAMSGEPWALVNSGTLVKDLVGLSAAPLHESLKFLALGGPTTDVEFDGDVIEMSPWGQYQIYGGGLTGTADPRCEAGGCMRVGPFDYDVCGVPRAGFAGVLQRGANGHVQLRYRVLAKPKYDDQPEPFLYGDVVTLELAAPSASTTDTGVPGGTGKVAKLASAVDGFSYGTDWATLDSPAPGSGTIGYAVIAGGPALVRGGCGGPPPPPTTVEILVESVKSN